MIKLWNPMKWWRRTQYSRNRQLWAAYCGCDAILQATQRREATALSNLVLERQDHAKTRETLVNCYVTRLAYNAQITLRAEYYEKLMAAHVRINELERAQFVMKGGK